MSYWGFRIDVNCQDYPGYYVKELNERRVLRQGWGYDESQNLRNLDQNNLPREQQANVRMFNVVKQGDFVLIPRIPEWELVTIARVTEDWDKGYVFGIDEDKGDYGPPIPRKGNHVLSPSKPPCPWRCQEYSQVPISFLGYERLRRVFGRVDRASAERANHQSRLGRSVQGTRGGCYEIVERAHWKGRSRGTVGAV